MQEKKIESKDINGSHIHTVGFARQKIHLKLLWIACSTLIPWTMTSVGK